jgi:PncC family amidohydrolase
MNDDLEFQVAEYLEKRKINLSTAESCTGGMLAGTLVNVPGISRWFEEGYVTYSNHAKEKLLGVSHATLERYGAVSEQTAGEMAAGAARVANADLALSTTGIAGPDGGTKEMPVGLVYIGCYFRGNIRVEKHIFSGDRQEVRAQAVQKALSLALRHLGHRENRGELT